MMRANITRMPRRWLVCLILMACATAQAQDWTYTVRGGDTLWALCEKYTTVKICWMKIGDYNNVKYPRTLAPGTQIRFPVDWLRDPPAPAEVAFVRGRVTLVDSSGERSEVQKGDLISIGMEIVVEQKSVAIIRFADQSLMSVESDSVVRFDVLSKFSKTGMVDTRLHLHKGAVHTKVPKRSPASRFEVSTPSSVAAVRGTDFRVASTPAFTRNEVFGGEVEVSNKANARDLTKGLGLLAKKDEVLPEAVQLLPAPSVTAVPASVSLPFLLAWSDVAGAQKYKVQLLKQDDAQTLAFSAESEFSEIVLNDIAEGCYSVRISAMDAAQFQGMPGDTSLCLQRALGSVAQPEITKIGRGKIRLSWPHVESADRYRIEFSNTENFARVVDSRVLAENRLDYEFDEQRPLYVKISAENQASSARSQDDKIYQAHIAKVSEKEILGPVLFVLMMIVAFL